jgi:hypothetical protein
MVFLSGDPKAARPLARFLRVGTVPSWADLVAFVLLAAAAILVVRGAEDMSQSLAVLHTTPVTLDSARLPEYALCTTLRMFLALGASLVFTLRVRRAGRQVPRGRKGAGAAARHPAVGPDPRLPGDHRRALHRAVPRQPAGRGMRGDLRHLHLAGLEHGLQPLPVAAHRARPSCEAARVFSCRAGSASGGWSCRSPCPACCGT